MFEAITKWLVSHGFVLNNREQAAIFWMVLLMAPLISKSEIRQGLVGVLIAATRMKIALLWVVYGLWILGFVSLADQVGFWQQKLTKNTLVWSVTSGILLLFKVSELRDWGSLRQLLPDIGKITLFVEYLSNMYVFSLFIEIILQPLLFFVILDPSVVDDPDHKVTLRRFSLYFGAGLGATVIIYNTIILIQGFGTLEYDQILLEIAWPVGLALWVLLILPPLALVASYEEAFVKLNMYSERDSAFWYTKVGLLLALRWDLKLVRKAANGGTLHVARTDSLQDSFKAARKFRQRASTEESQ